MKILNRYILFLFCSVIAMLITASILHLIINGIDLAAVMYFGVPAILTSTYFVIKDLVKKNSALMVTIRFVVSFLISLPIAFLTGYALTGGQALRQLTMDQEGQNTIGAAIVMGLTIIIAIPVLTPLFYNLLRRFFKK